MDSQPYSPTEFELAKDLFFQGLELLKKNELLLAQDAFLKSLQIIPNRVSTLTNLAATYIKQKKYSQSLEISERAISIDERNAQAWLNLGVAKQYLKMFDKALLDLDRAIELEPDYFDAYWNKSLIKLLLADFDDGWELYEYRWKKINASQYRYSHINKLLTLRGISNKRVLVWHEQGFGDSIQFSRYVPLLVQAGANVTFEVQKPLLGLFENQFKGKVVSQIDQKKNKFDFQIPLLSLPRLFKTNLSTVPEISNLNLDRTKIDLWNKKLGLSSANLNIGVAVSGSPTHENDHIRSMPLHYLEPLLNKYNLYLIQKELSVHDKEFLTHHDEITYLGSGISDFNDTASIIKNLDLIISVDTSLIHLAGLLNKKAFLLLPWVPEWRWLLDKDRSPWYPSIKIFRQDSIDNWASVIDQIQNQLIK